jgi:hypothetical protein
VNGGQAVIRLWLEWIEDHRIEETVAGSKRRRIITLRILGEL